MIIIMIIIIMIIIIMIIIMIIIIIIIIIITIIIIIIIIRLHGTWREYNWVTKTHSRPNVQIKKIIIMD